MAVFFWVFEEGMLKPTRHLLPLQRAGDPCAAFPPTWKRRLTSPRNLPDGRGSLPAGVGAASRWDATVYRVSPASTLRLDGRAFTVRADREVTIPLEGAIRLFVRDDPAHARHG
jgi:hypothetical protein